MSVDVQKDLFACRYKVPWKYTFGENLGLQEIVYLEFFKI